jgi:glucosamine-6-phosphate deaminase
MTEHTPFIHIAPDAATAAEHTALLLVAALHAGNGSTLGLATGATMIPVYGALVAAYNADEVSFRDAVTFNLDEYVGLGPDQPGSFHRFMRRHLFDHVDITPALTHIPNGLAEDTAAEAARYEAEIEAAGGIELQLLGIGANGHIGFNEPGSDFSSRTREIELDEATRSANAANFPGRAVPERAITMGIATILEARHIVLLATGEEKADAIAAALEGPLTTECPASALRLHRDVRVICDEAAAGKLSHRTHTSPRHSGARSCASPESITTTGAMDSGPAPSGASRNDRVRKS